ncbi:hypothetical protein JW805_18550 [Roseomonas aeriglobus]|nr:hypothetical protein [Roseomonas aeriglobus]
MTRRLGSLVLVASLLLAGCDGPRENAGEQADANAGVVSSEDTLASGPPRRPARHRIVPPKAPMRRSRRVPMLQRTVRTPCASTADEKADALEEQARQVRRDAEQKADVAEDRADAIRGK